MKTTVDIPDKDLADVMKYSGAHTKREAILTAIREYNRRKGMAALVRYAGTCTNLITVEELRRMRGCPE